MNLVTVLRAWIRATPDAPAVDGAAEVLTYAQLGARAETLAAALRDHGVTPGATVGLALDDRVDLVVGMVATQFAGAAYLGNVVDLGTKGTLAAAGTIPVLNAAAGLEVAAALVLLFHEFLEEVMYPDE